MVISFHKTVREEGLIRPSRSKRDPRIGPDALQVLIKADLDNLIKLQGQGQFDCRNFDFFKLYSAKGDSRGLSLFGPFLGAPQAVMGLEKVITLGAERIWVLGWCGSLQTDLKIGDFVIPTNALIEEGTSSHYPLGDRDPATDLELNNMIETALKKRGQTVRTGGIWTTDAPYRETPSKIAAYRSLGLLAVEMEMSALMTVALFRGVRLAGLLIVSDELADMKWRHGFSDPRFRNATRTAGEVLFELASAQVRRPF